MSFGRCRCLLTERKKERKEGKRENVKVEKEEEVGKEEGEEERSSLLGPALKMSKKTT